MKVGPHEHVDIIDNTIIFYNHTIIIREETMGILLRKSIMLFVLVMLTMGFLSPTAQGSEKWFVWSNDVGWLHLGQKSEFEREKPRRLETWGGTSDDPLVKTKRLGPFDTKELALEKLEQAVTELEQRYNRLAYPKYYLVAKIGGKEYKLGSEIKLKKKPILRFGPTYLIHITRTYTMSGPVDKDGYVLHHTLPVGGKFITADGSGGTFTNEGESKGGPFTTNYELCPVLRSLGQTSITLSNNRIIDCSDPWWEGQSSPDQEDQPDESDEPEEPDAGGKISLRILLEDKDDQLTPADEADLRFEIKNTTADKDLSAIMVKISLQGRMIETEALWFSDAEKKDYSSALRMIKLIPGQVWDFSRHIRVASERNQWIYENLIKHSANDRKPKPEKGVDLNSMVKLTVTGKVAASGEEAGQEVTLFDGPVSVLDKNGKVLRLAYPDLSGIAGRPLGADDLQDYYQRGDAYYSHPGNEFIRALAFRASRYEDTSATVMPTSGTLVARGDADDPGPLFPEGPDVRGIVNRMARFVHACLFPKQVDKSNVPSKDLAKKIWTGQLRPDKDAVGTHFICQEHSFLLGSLLRALGFSVREVNIMQHYQPLRASQDAATEVFHNRRWNFWGLFDNRGPFTDHLAYYAGYFVSYDMYVGARRSSDYKPRFHMTIKEMNRSPLWQYWGVGNWSGFTQLSNQWASINMVSQWIFGVDSKIQAIIEFFSPVAATVVSENGQRVGTESRIDPEEYWKYLFLSGEKPATLVCEIPGALYFPEGLTLYPDASDASTAIKMPQTIMIPVKNPEEIKSYRMRLKGTGDGPYEINVSFVDKKGELHRSSSIKGIAQKGKTTTHAGTEVELASITQAFGTVPEDHVIETPDKVIGEDTGSKDWRVSVTLNRPRSAMTAHIEYLGKTKYSDVVLAEKARTAALPDMMSFVESLPAVNKSTFKDLFNKDSSLKAEVGSVLKNAVFSEIGRTRKGNPTFTLWIPVSEIRMAAGLEHF